MIIPKTSNKDRLGENMDILDFTIADDDMDKISSLNRNIRFYDPKYWNEPIFFNIAQNAPYF